VKTALKGKRFRDAEAFKKNVKTELNAVPLEAFADCIQKLVFKQAEINLNRNKKMYFLVYFCFFFYTSSGTLLPTSYILFPYSLIMLLYNSQFKQVFPSTPMQNLIITINKHLLSDLYDLRIF
jgi:hypothetical protein